MKTVAISLDGVLRKESDAQAQDRGGALLYESLTSSFRVVILGTHDAKKDDHFLTINGYLSHVKLEPERIEDAPTIIGRRRMQLTRLRAEGFQFEFVVVPDPELATGLYRTGVPVLLYLHPEYTTESFRPDYAGGIRPWNELAAEVEYQRTTAAEQRKRESESHV